MILAEQQKAQLLAAIQRNPGQFTVKALEDFLEKYDNLSIDDYRGKVTDDKLSIIENKMAAILAEQAWNNIKAMPVSTADQIQTVINSISDFMISYPMQSSQAQEYAGQLQEKLVKLAGQAEEDDWNRLDKGSYSSMLRYIRQYPNSIHKDEIDDIMWDITKLPKTASTFQRYLDDWPNGRHAEEARISKDFLNDWDKAKQDKDIFIVDYYRDSLSSDSPFYYDVDVLYQALRADELAEMKKDPTNYPKEKVDRLLSANIFTKEELIDEDLITEQSWDVLTMDRSAFPKLEEYQGKNALPPSRDYCTDIYLFGTPGTGKTCLLMGLIGGNGNGYNLNLKVGAGEYAAALQEYVNVGFVPGATHSEWVSAISGRVYETSKKGTPITHNFNLVEMAGEQFAFGIVKNKTNDMASMGLGATELLKNKNRKCFFIIVDCSNDKITYKYMEKYRGENGEMLTRPRKALISQSVILTQFVGLFTLPENQSIMEKVDAIHFVVTKADKLGDNDAERAEAAKKLLLTKYNAPIQDLKMYCQKTKRINYSTNYEPLMFTFSLGKFYIGDVYEYDPRDSMRIMNTIKSLTKGVKEKTSWWDRFLGAIGD